MRKRQRAGRRPIVVQLGAAGGHAGLVRCVRRYTAMGHAIAALGGVRRDAVHRCRHSRTADTLHDQQAEQEQQQGIEASPGHH